MSHNTRQHGILPEMDNKQITDLLYRVLDKRIEVVNSAGHAFGHNFLSSSLAIWDLVWASLVWDVPPSGALLIGRHVALKDMRHALRTLEHFEDGTQPKRSEHQEGFFHKVRHFMARLLKITHLDTHHHMDPRLFLLTDGIMRDLEDLSKTQDSGSLTESERQAIKDRATILLGQGQHARNIADRFIDIFMVFWDIPHLPQKLCNVPQKISSFITSGYTFVYGAVAEMRHLDDLPKNVVAALGGVKDVAVSALDPKKRDLIFKHHPYEHIEDHSTHSPTQRRISKHKMDFMMASGQWVFQLFSGYCVSSFLYSQSTQVSTELGQGNMVSALLYAVTSSLAFVPLNVLAQLCAQSVTQMRRDVNNLRALTQGATPTSE